MFRCVLVYASVEISLKDLGLAEMFESKELLPDYFCTEPEKHATSADLRDGLRLWKQQQLSYAYSNSTISGLAQI